MTTHTEPIVTPQGYRLESTGGGWWHFYHHQGGLLGVFTTEELEQLHLAVAILGACGLPRCPCWQDGHEKGLETPREPFRTR